MKFSPETPRRRRPAPVQTREVLEMASQEPEQLVFDPERDIPAKTLEYLLGIGPHAIECYPLLNLILPDKIPDAFREKVIQQARESIQLQMSESVGSVRISHKIRRQMVYLSWIDPNFRGDFVDLTTPNMLGRAKRVVSPSKKVDLWLKEIMTQKLLSPDYPGTLNQMASDLEFLLNFFSDAQSIVERVLAAKQISPALVKMHILNGGVHMPDLLLVFPKFRQSLIDEPGFLDQLRQEVKVGISDPHTPIPSTGWIYLSRVLSYAILTAQHASLDEHGVHLVLGEKTAVKPAPPLPGRDVSV